jgi:hypothetical protein
MPAIDPSAAHTGAQQAPMYSFFPDGQGQVLVQPSDMPARLPSAGQVGVQTQRPSTHLPLVPQLLPQLQVSMHLPALHTLPAAQVTPAHGSATHWPLTQVWPDGQVTPAHGLGVAHERLHAAPGPQSAAHGLSITHLPVPGSQY